MNHPLQTKAFKASGAIQPARFVVLDPALEGVAAQADASADALMGVSQHQVLTPNGGTVDVHLSGIVPVIYGANVRAGYPLTSDANGNAVEAAPGVGVIAQVGGYALVPGVAGDIGVVNLNRQQLKG